MWAWEAGCSPSSFNREAAAGEHTQAHAGEIPVEKLKSSAVGESGFYSSSFPLQAEEIQKLVHTVTEISERK